MENEILPLCQPSLIVLTGRPASGKTTLAHSLAQAIRCPVVSRDAIKEGVVNTTGQTEGAGSDIGRQIYEAFFDTIKILLYHRVTLIAEAAFQHKLWSPQIELLREVAHVRIVVCAINAETARARFIERGSSDPLRERFHHDRFALAAREGHEPPPIEDYDPPHSDASTLLVDTSNGYQPDFEAIVSFAMASIRRQSL